MSKIFFTSDNHFFHINVIRYCNRPFTKNLDLFLANSVDFEDPIKKSEAIQRDVLEMNETMVLNWNTTVSSGDTVYHLGDFAFAAKAVEEYTPRLNGKKILIVGNHDFPHPSHKKSKRPENRDKWIQQYKAWGWSDVKVKDQIEIPGIGLVNLHHIPYASGYTEKDEEGRQRKVQKYAAPDDTIPLLCGHVHDKWGVRKTPGGILMVNVGIDSPGMPWSGQMRPATLDEIVRTIKENK